MYLIDTDIIIEYLRGNKIVVKRLIDLLNKRLFITTISIAELFYGIYQSSKVKENHEKFRDFLSNVEILTIEFENCKTFGKIKSKLKKEGNLIDNLDLFIACICLDNNLTLVTNNEKHFRRLKDLKIMNIK